MADTDPVEDDLVLFRACADDVEALGLQSLLEAHGIRSFIQGQHHRTLLGPFANQLIPANVLVAQSEIEKATSIAAARAEEIPQTDDDDGDLDLRLGRRRQVLRWVVILGGALPLVSALLLGLGVRLARPQHARQSRCDTLELCLESCDRGDGSACGRAADRRMRAKQESLALQPAVRGCQLGDPNACAWLLTLRTDKNLVVPAADLATAKTVFEAGCLKLHAPVACVLLGSSFEDGLGTEKNEALAASYFLKACDMEGGSSGCSALGNMYADGRGVAKDWGAACTYFKRACAKDAALDYCKDLARCP